MEKMLEGTYLKHKERKNRKIHKERKNRKIN